MEKIIDWLSAGVPGGIVLFLLLLLIINLAFSFSKSSKLLSPERSKKNRLIYSLALLMIYIALWLITQPPKPRIRVVVLPAISTQTKFRADAVSFEFPELFQRYAHGALADKYLLHRWNWLYETIGSDSVNDRNQWYQTARALDAGIIIKPVLTQKGISCTVVFLQDSMDFEAQTPHQLLGKISAHTDLFKEKTGALSPLNKQYLPIRLMLLNRQYDKVIELGIKDKDALMVSLAGEAYARQGLLQPVDFEKAKYVKAENYNLEQAKNLLVQTIKDKTDTPQTAYWLGRIAIYEQDYTRAEIFLKKALIEDPSNARIYFALGYLHPDRLSEFGYYTRTDILQKTVQLDPAFRDAVYQLAEEYYRSGTGTESGTGTTRARQTIEAFLKIKKEDLKILSLLASIEMKLQYYDKALKIYSKIAARLPEQSDSWYNIGIVYFMKKEYQDALSHFLKAIDMDENLDSYLYAGVTYRILGDTNQALKFYRERVMRKTGADDVWAKEAMKGIRKILADSTGQR